MLKIKTVSKGAELVSVLCDDIEKIHDGLTDRIGQLTAVYDSNRNKSRLLQNDFQ